MLPCYYFWKYLAQKSEEFRESGNQPDQIHKNLNPKLKVWIPDTIILNDNDETENFNFWLYSNEAGEVWRTDDFTQKNTVSRYFFLR